MWKNKKVNIVYSVSQTYNMTKTSKYLQQNQNRNYRKHIAASAIVQLYFIQHFI